MPERKSNAEKIVSQLKGLRGQLQPGEEPDFSLPVIWDGGQQAHSETCDLVITNRRLFAYYFRSFPREKLFFDALNLSAIKNVTFRQKSYEPVFRELKVSTDTRTVYIRAPRAKSEELYAALRTATKSDVTTNSIESEPASPPESTDSADTTTTKPAPIYARQEIRRPFDNSPLAILLLFVGGIILEVVGAVLWSMTSSAPTGLPLCVAGFVAACIGILLRRQNRKA